MDNKDFETMMQALTAAEEKRLGVGSEEFVQRHEEIMEMIDKAMQKDKAAGCKRREEKETKEVVEMVTLKEASSRTGISYDQLRKMCINRQIIHIKAGCKFLINWDKLVDYLNTGEPGGSDEMHAE